MLITITLNTDNAAFQESAYDQAQETARILGQLAEAIRDEGIPVDGQKVRDINGNTVGQLTTQEGGH